MSREFFNSGKLKTTEDANSPESLNQVLSRRQFVQRLGIATTSALSALLLASGQRNRYLPYFTAKPEIQRFQEQYVRLFHTSFVDFAPDKPTPGVEQSVYPNNDKLSRNLLKDDYLSSSNRLIDVIGYILTGKDLEEKILTKYPQYGLVKGGLDHFSNHGAIVTATHRKLLNKMGFDTSGKIIPIQNAIDEERSNSNIEDKLGNRGVEFFISGDKLIKLLRKEKNLPRVINFSFQLGVVRMMRIEKTYFRYRTRYKAKTVGERTYLFNPKEYFHVTSKDTDPPSVYFQSRDSREKVTLDRIPSISTEEYQQYQRNPDAYTVLGHYHNEINDFKFINIEGAYQGEYGLNNFLELVKVAKAFPDQLFVCAAGNYGDDLRPIREKLGDEWPANILLVGQWSSRNKSPTQNGRQIHGADLYVDNENCGLEDGSSLSTAIVSAFASILIELKFTNPQIKEMLLYYTKRQTYTVDYSREFDEAPPEETVVTLQPKKIASSLILDHKLLSKFLAALVILHNENNASQQITFQPQSSSTN